MAKLTYNDPSTGEEKTIEADIPVGMETNQNFLTKTIKEYLARNSKVEQSRRASHQGLQGGADLTKPVSYTAPSKLPENSKGIRKTLIGPSGGQPANIPMVSPFVDTANKALQAPISGGSWQDRTADIVEGVGSILGAGMLPEMAGAPVKALTSLLPAIAAQKGVENVTGNRLAGDIAGVATGGLELGSPKIRAVTRGAVGGAVKTGVGLDATYHGIPVPPSIAGGALGSIAGRAVGHPEAGAITGAALPVVKGAYMGGKEAAAGVPWFEFGKVASHDDPLFTSKLDPEVANQPLGYTVKPGQVIGSKKVDPPLGYKSKPGEILRSDIEDPQLGYKVKAGKPMDAGIEDQPLGYKVKPGQKMTRNVDPPEGSSSSKPNSPKNGPNEKLPESQKTEETKLASSETKVGEAEPKEVSEVETSKPNDKDINPVMDKVLALAKPEWSGEQIDYPHIVQVADKIGVKPNQIRTMLKDLGYDVVPSKFPERTGKKLYKDVPWDKLMKALSNLSEK